MFIVTCANNKKKKREDLVWVTKLKDVEHGFKSVIRNTTYYKIHEFFFATGHSIQLCSPLDGIRNSQRVEMG